jgi:hypothetical protein
MKRLKVLTALAMGIMASSSGVLQVKAADYNFSVDFSEKEVDNFDDYRQSFYTDTYNLDGVVNFNFIGSYRFDSCPTAFTLNANYFLFGRPNSTGSYVQIATGGLPDFVCTTTNTTYFAQISGAGIPAIYDAIVDDDADYFQFRSEIRLANSVATNGRTMSLLGYRFFLEYSYDFNTTYLFNYFLSDQRYEGRVSTGATFTFNGVQTNQLQYLYTTAGDDTYTIFNSNSSDIGTTRKKYAVDYNEEFFRGESVGAEFDTSIFGTDTILFTSSTGSASLIHTYFWYYLNVSNVAQQLVDAPIFEFEEEDCGSFLALNVGCFINNAFAYITNDAPIVSDAFTLLNAGIEMAAQTFGIIGEFADDNVFGVLILAGFGFIAVKWFLKND